MSQIAELGRTRLYTRRERRRRLTAIALALLGAVVASWIAAAVVAGLSGADPIWPSIRLRPILTSDAGGDGSGGGGLLGLPHADQHIPATPPRGHVPPGPVPPGQVPPGPPLPGAAPSGPPAGATPETPPAAPSGAPPGAGPRRAQFPITVTWPAPVGWTITVAAPLWLAWLRFLVRPLLAGLRQPIRHRGLAQLPAIRRELGTQAARRTGRYTLPGTPWWIRFVLPTRAFGYLLGRPLHHGKPRRRMRLWADWEQRVRLVARPGWGKTDRLLVPIIRALPGAALVASIEPGIFEQTVTARQRRQTPLRWPWLALLLRPWLPMRDYPVAVVDFSAADRRYAAGYPPVRWSPVLGGADYAVAHRRAVALITGATTAASAATVGSSENAQFFLDSAAEVLGAWLHAADLAGKDIDDLLSWLRHADDPTPTRILRDHPLAEPSAAVNLRRHLDPDAARTTSGVLRYLTLGMNSLATAEGRDLCGRRGDTQFDMEQMITAGGTVYLLADTSRIDRTRPLLSLLAGEMFLAAEAVALRHPRRRLPMPFIAVVDELRNGIIIPNLPYVASAQRKYGTGYIYGVQSASQEDAVYGPDAPALRAAAGVTIIGGIDIDSARELSDRAGVTPVVTLTRGPEQRSEHIQLQDTLTIADQQRLRDGQAVVIARGLAPFLAWLPSFRDNRRQRRTILREADTVARHVAAARDSDLAGHRSHTTATRLGATFGADVHTHVRADMEADGGADGGVDDTDRGAP